MHATLLFVVIRDALTDEPSPPGGGPRMSDLRLRDTGWVVRAYVQAGAMVRPVEVGRGGLRFDGPEPVLSFSFFDATGRVAMEEGGAFVQRGAGQESHWLDFTDPVVLPADGDVMAIGADPDVRRVRTEPDGAGGDLHVHAQFGPATVTEEAIRSEVREVWTTPDDRVRRMAVRTTVRARTAGSGAPVRLLTVMDRDDGVEVPPSPHRGDDVVPATASLQLLTADPSAAGVRGGDGSPGRAPVFAALGTSAARVGARSGADAEAILAQDGIRTQLDKPTGCRGPFKDRETGDRYLKCDPKDNPVFQPAAELDDPALIEPPGLKGAEDEPERPSEEDVAAAKRDFDKALGACFLGYAGYAASLAQGGPAGMAAAIVATGWVFWYCSDAGDKRRDLARLRGEPHITTLDGHRYSLQAVGEFVHVTSPSFEVQARFEGSKGLATFASATAVRAGDHVVEIHYDRSMPGPRGIPVLVDGARIDVDFAGVTLADGTILARRSGGERDRNVLMVDPSGNYVLVENLNRSQNVVLRLTEATRSRVTGGLAGIPDGDVANDFSLRDGSALGFADARTVRGLYGRFAGGWRVRPPERLFTRGRAEDFLSAAMTALPERVSGLGDFTPEQVRRARERCERAGVAAGAALEDCAHDLLVTKDDGWAEQASVAHGSRRQRVPSAPSGGEAAPDDPLLVAADQCTAGHDDCAQVVELLLKAGANPDDRGEEGVTALYLAAQNGRSETLDALLAAGADPRLAAGDGDTPLLVSAFHGHTEVARRLIDAGGFADVARGGDGFTPLLAAAQENRPAVLDVLLAAGADPRRTDDEGRSALATASYRGHGEIVKQLLGAGADADQSRVRDGVAPLHFAAQEGRPGIVRALLAAGAKPGIADDGGSTPLHVAARQDDPEIVALLLEAGADRRAEDDDGRTAVDVAGPQAREELR